MLVSTAKTAEPVSPVATELVVNSECSLEHPWNTTVQGESAAFQRNRGSSRWSFARPAFEGLSTSARPLEHSHGKEAAGTRRSPATLESARERTHRVAATRDLHKKASYVVVSKSVPDEGPPVTGGSEGQPMSSPEPEQAGGAGDVRLA